MSKSTILHKFCDALHDFKSGSGFQRAFSNPWNALLALVGLSLAMRIFSFFPSVIDHDESTYILIADAMRHGQVYQRDVIDTKPAGIFILFGLFQILFGNSVIAIRIITSVWIGLTAWMLYLTHQQIQGRNTSELFNPAPPASGIIYVMMISVFTMYGISPNTEQFFSLFTITALFLMVKFRAAGWFLLAGLLLGIGFTIKYVVLFDALALGLFFIWIQVTEKKSYSYWLLRCFLMGAGFLIPILSIWLYYLRLGMGESFWFYFYELNSRYFIRPPLQNYVLFILESFLRFFPVTFWFLYCLRYWRTTGPNLPLLGLTWVTIVMIIILLPGKLFSHYFIQAMLPLSLLAGSFFDVRRSPGRYLAWMRSPSIGYPLICLVLLINWVYQKKDYYDKKDYPVLVASYLNTRLQPGDVLYSGNYHPIIYLLTGTSSPTPYVHRSLIWGLENSFALNINSNEEFDKIKLQKPRFITMSYPVTENNTLFKWLQESYTARKTFDDKVTVYERN